MSVYRAAHPIDGSIHSVIEKLLEVFFNQLFHQYVDILGERCRLLVGRYMLSVG